MNKVFFSDKYSASCSSSFLICTVRSQCHFIWVILHLQLFVPAFPGRMNLQIKCLASAGCNITQQDCLAKKNFCSIACTEPMKGQRCVIHVLVWLKSLQTLHCTVVLLHYWDLTTLKENDTTMLDGGGFVGILDLTRLWVNMNCINLASQNKLWILLT